MMTPRLLELHRVLKPTGSIYLHCDPTASHYLKLVLDQIFDVENFRNEIIWQKIRTKKSQTIGFGNVHDTIFAYSKTNNVCFHNQLKEFKPEYIKSHYKPDPNTGRLYRTVSLLQKGQGPTRKFGYQILEPPTGMHWIWSQDRINEAINKGLIRFTSGGRPEKIQYLDEMKGDIVDDIWIDIPPVNPMALERLGYPTQKPLALLERIVQASSNEGDIVLDPFCGCGTTIVASEKLNRRWIGIDITHLAIALMKSRLQDTFSDSAKYDVIGEPTDLSGAHALARQDRYQFQWWALSLVKARPVDQNQKKGADKGIDGIKYINITPGLKKPQTIKVVVQVKSGHVQVKDVREFKTVIENTKSEMGLFVTLEEPTAPMTQEAISSGYYKPLGIIGAIQCPKVQILTIEELLNGKKVQYPMHDDITFRRAEKVEDEEGENLEIDFTK